jgi:hypothetical protein
MNGVPDLASAMLAIAFATGMLVAGQSYITHRPASFTPAALVTSVSWGKPYANLPH